jgi:hypothetical protein
VFGQPSLVVEVLLRVDHHGDDHDPRDVKDVLEPSMISWRHLVKDLLNPHTDTGVALGGRVNETETETLLIGSETPRGV